MVPYSHYLKSMIIVSIVVVLTDAMLVSVIMGVSAHILRREATLGRRLICYFKALRIFLLDSSLFSTYQTPLQISWLPGYTTQSHLTRGNIKHNIHINSEITLHLYRRRTTQLTRLGNNNLAYQIEKDQFKSPD